MVRPKAVGCTGSTAERVLGKDTAYYCGGFTKKKGVFLQEGWGREKNTHRFIVVGEPHLSFREQKRGHKKVLDKRIEH